MYRVYRIREKRRLIINNRLLHLSCCETRITHGHDTIHKLSEKSSTFFRVYITSVKYRRKYQVIRTSITCLTEYFCALNAGIGCGLNRNFEKCVKYLTFRHSLR